MRLTADQVKQAILSDDREVRGAAAYYFARSYSDDPGVMPLVIQAIEQLGWSEAFETFSFMPDLVQTDETVLWLLGQIKNFGHGSGEERDRYAYTATNALMYADVTVLERHASQIIDLVELDERQQDLIRQRIDFATQSPEILWLQLTEYCQRNDAIDEVPKDLELANRLTEALSRHPEFAVHKIVPILDGTTGDDGNWIELFAVRLAGELRLHKAVTQIVRLLTTADDWIFEEGERALIKIGGDDVVEEIARVYPASDFGFKITASTILESIHTDLSVETAFRLFGIEEADDDDRCRLLQAALLNFSTDAIEPARQFILATPPSPELLEVRSDLLVACKVMGETFPEFDAWVEDAKNDVEFRRNWYRQNPLISNVSDDEEDLDDDEELDDEFDEDERLPLPEQLVRDVRVGRNDPCPCGSGKKFKKCCLPNMN